MEPQSIDVILIDYVIHDIDEMDRLEIVQTLSYLIKSDGIWCIFEPTNSDHGISVKTLLDLLHSIDLYEKYFKIDSKRKTYAGIYQNLAESINKM